MGEIELLDQEKADDLWKSCFCVFEEFVDKITYETVLKNTKVKPINKDTVEILLSKPWQKDKLEKYVETISQVYSERAGRKIKFNLSVGKNGFEDNHVRISPVKKESVAKKTLEKKTMENPRTREIKLDPNYTFDTFVVGNRNSMAAAAARAVAKSPAKAYNPLFIYGGSGLGKTHLLTAIGHNVLETNPESRVVYVTTENFTNDFVESIQNKKMQQFRRKYRYSDLFLIDDIQFLKNKEQMQEEFFHTFNELHGAKSQVVITSDRHPRDIPTLEERLRSRFEMGLIVDIQPPELETRMAILKKKAELLKMKIPNDVVAFIAEQITTNIRELEGALNKLYLHVSATGREVDMDLCLEALQPVLQDSRPKHLTISTIQEKVCEYYDISMDELLGSCREAKLIVPRHVAIYLCREMLGASFPSIAKAFGGRHHSTILTAYRKVNKKNTALRMDIENIRNMLKKGSG